MSRDLPAGLFPPGDRRAFLASSLHAAGGAWLALLLPDIERTAVAAREALRLGAPFQTLTAAEARIAEAVAVAIMPDDDTPGAGEAGVVHFMDRALGSFFDGMLPLIREGLADLDARARARGADGFAALAAADRDATLREVESTPFFGNMFLMTVAGMFGDPSWGGNRGGAGWKLLGIEHRPVHAPPFGWYDAQAASGGGA